MKHMTRISLMSLASVLALTGTAHAGSLAVPVAEQPVIVPVAPINTGGEWTGFYAGLNLGYADISTNVPGVEGDNNTYGIHAGYDYDFGSFVLGGELEYDKTDIDLDGAVDVDDVARLKLRGGYDLGNTLVYVTAGAARVSTSLGNDTGGFGGLGVAYKVTDRFTVGGEVLEHRFNDIDGTGVDADATTFNIRGSYRF